MAGIYLHIPFCAQRCVYCDFYFVTTKMSRTPFVQALCTELEHYAATYASREPVETIYFGGGTPSLLHPDEIQRIMETILMHYDAVDVREVTLELNPGDVDLDYLRNIRAVGIDRLSIGIQSFFEQDLRFMNRSHTVEEAESIVPMARKAGFDNFSIDLIFGLPGQPSEYWAANLQKAADLNVPHLSTYGLTIEERTPLFNQVQRGLVRAADEEEVAERYRFTMDYLRGQGYEHYEISSFARSGMRAQHNQLYWEHENYLGFGPSAHSFWWQQLPRSSVQRWSNIRNLKQYEALLSTRQLPLENRENLTLDTLADEYVMLRLRTSDGLDLDRLENVYGVDLLTDKIDELAWLEQEGYIYPIRNQVVRLTDSGKLLCDTITSKLIADESFH
jgi:oxygen-independent coproporphyrinogen III oxidase